MKLRVFKPLEWRTASIEVYQDDGEQIVAEVFARDGGKRRLYMSDSAAKRGLDWSEFAALVPQVTALLDEADQEMHQVRISLGEE